MFTSEDDLHRGIPATVFFLRERARCEPIIIVDAKKMNAKIEPPVPVPKVRPPVVVEPPKVEVAAPPLAQMRPPGRPPAIALPQVVARGRRDPDDDSSEEEEQRSSESSDDSDDDAVQAMLPLPVPVDTRSIEDQHADFWQIVAELQWHGAGDGPISPRVVRAHIAALTPTRRATFYAIYAGNYRILRALLTADDMFARNNLNSVQAQAIVISHVIALGKDQYATLSADKEFIQVLVELGDCQSLDSCLEEPYQMATRQ